MEVRSGDPNNPRTSIVSVSGYWDNPEQCKLSESFFAKDAETTLDNLGLFVIVEPTWTALS